MCYNSSTIRYTRAGNRQHTRSSVSIEIRVKITQKVRTEYDDICQNCGVKCDDTDFEIVRGNKDNKRLGGNYPTMDHIIPAIDGGRFEVENLRLLCNDCNFNLGMLQEWYR
jgi:5-methylcytosine-specific restriction endonuclease McrA